jgi:hypothetical protein
MSLVRLRQHQVAQPASRATQRGEAESAHTIPRISSGLRDYGAEGGGVSAERVNSTMYA